jgi:hypothetical protein
MVTGNELAQTLWAGVTETVGIGFTVAITWVAGLAQPETVFVTQYVVFVEMLGVVKVDPIPTCVVKPTLLYHVRLPLPDAPRTTVPVPHLAAGTTVGAAGIGVTVAITSTLGPSQPAALVHDAQ